MHSGQVKPKLDRRYLERWGWDRVITDPYEYEHVKLKRIMYLLVQDGGESTSESPLKSQDWNLGKT